MVYCPYCGAEVSKESAFCSNCGSYIIDKMEKEMKVSDKEVVEKPQPAVKPAVRPTSQVEVKSSGTAILLALFLGLFGFMGVGHWYVNRLGRGFLFLFIGLSFPVIIVYSTIFIIPLGPMMMPIILPIIIVAGLGWFIVWLIQIFDANKLAVQYNRILQETGNPPW
jgi:hypothetical protein